MSKLLKTSSAKIHNQQLLKTMQKSNEATNISYILYEQKEDVHIGSNVLAKLNNKTNPYIYRSKIALTFS